MLTMPLKDELVNEAGANDVSAVSTNGSGDLAGNPFGAKGSYNIRLTKKNMCIAGYHSPLILICMPVVASPQFFDDKIIASRKCHGMSFSFVSTCSVKLWCCCRSSWQKCEQINNKWGQTSSIIINNYPTFDSDRQNCSPCPSAIRIAGDACGHWPWHAVTLEFPNDFPMHPSLAV